MCEPVLGKRVDQGRGGGVEVITSSRAVMRQRSLALEAGDPASQVGAELSKTVASIEPGVDRRQDMTSSA